MHELWLQKPVGSDPNSGWSQTNFGRIRVKEINARSVVLLVDDVVEKGDSPSDPRLDTAMQITRLMDRVQAMEKRLWDPGEKREQDQLRLDVKSLYSRADHHVDEVVKLDSRVAAIEKRLDLLLEHVKDHGERLNSHHQRLSRAEERLKERMA